MAPRKGGSNELTRLLRAQSEPVVNGWIDDLLSKLQFRRKLPKQASREQLTQIAREIYDSLVTSLSSIPSKGNTRKLRLKKSHKKYIEALSLVELQQAQLILLDRLLAAVGKEYSAKPKKVQKYTSMLNQGIHDLILQTSKADLERRKKGHRARRKQICAASGYGQRRHSAHEL